MICKKCNFLALEEINTNFSPKVDTVCTPSIEVSLVLNLPKITFRLQAIRVLLLGLSSCLRLESKRKLESQESKICYLINEILT